jgi:ABC-type nitrate/sulfonate/bicarbonate transport system substrate-binding protein
MKKWFGWVTTVLVVVVLVTACSGNAGNQAGKEAGGETGSGTSGELKKVTMVLDWSANTNHTGLYVAREKGYYAEAGLDVNIIQPGAAGADSAVASGSANFGISSQENLTYSRTQGVPLVSIAAVIQHNTSGFASLQEKGLTHPSDFEGLKYGGWGAPSEAATIDALMKSEGADASTVQMLNTGEADFFTIIERDVDFSWIFQAWTGIEAELRGVDLNMVYLNEYAPELDYYTPIIITNEDLIATDPELVSAFMAATSKGYDFAIASPAEAAELLITAEPEINAELVRASQEWLSPRYQDDAPRWGEQKLSVWQDYVNWMKEYELLEGELNIEDAFTNDFLPESE